MDNDALAAQLEEVMLQYQSGLITSYELLAKSLEIASQMQFPAAGSIDINTGLRYA